MLVHLMSDCSALIGYTLINLRPQSLRYRTYLFVLLLCPFDNPVGIGTFVIGLSQISSCFPFKVKCIGIFGMLIFFITTISELSHFENSFWCEVRNSSNIAL